MTNFKIDGIDVQAKEDETILNVARRLSMYIPTMCYLEKQPQVLVVVYV